MQINPTTLSNEMVPYYQQTIFTTNDDTTNPPPPVVPWESEYISCIYGNDYPQEYHIHIPLRELMLFDSKDHVFDWGGMILTLAKRNVPLANIQKLIDTQQNNFRGQHYDMQSVVMDLATHDDSQS